MMAGPAWPEGRLLMVTENEMDLPFSDTVMLSVLPEKLAVTDDGLPGSVPSSYFWRSWLISACLHAQSALLETLPPPWKVKGSLSAFETGVPSPLGMAGQPVLPPDDVWVVLVGAALVVRDVLRVVDCWGALVVVLVLAGAAVVGPVPGRHWKYHAFCWKQYVPSTQSVGPVHPMPPHWPQTLWRCWALTPAAPRATRRADARAGDNILKVSKSSQGHSQAER